MIWKENIFFQKMLIVADLASLRQYFLFQVSDGKISIDFLLPNGMFIPKTVDFDMPLDMLKQVYPKTNLCVIIGITHVFSCINICHPPRKLFEHEAVRPSVQTSSKGPCKC